MQRLIPTDSARIAPTWEACLAAEPLLKYLAISVAQPPTLRTPAAYNRRYIIFKYRLSRLVGWFATNPELRTSQHWMAVFDHLHPILEGAYE